MLIPILVEPEYEENLGLIARVAKNFGIKELRIVNSKVNFRSGLAKSRAMHASELLLNAKEFPSIEEATRDCNIIASTSAKSSFGKNLLRNSITPENFAEKFAKSKEKIAILFGRESIGLKLNEIEKTHLLVSIPTSKEYATLNISHAAAIIFYEFFKHSSERKKFEIASSETLKSLFDSYAKIVEKLENIKNKKACRTAFVRVISRAAISEREAKTLLAVIAEVSRWLENAKG